MKKIAIITGGTAGHVFPAIALAKELQKENTVKIITDERGAKFIDDSFETVILPIRRFSKKTFLFKGIWLLIKSIIAIKDSKKTIFFGSYASFFPYIASFLLGKKRIIYQLDSHITRLNRILIPSAHHVLYAFAQTNFEIFRKKINKTCCGIPLRDEFEYEFPKNKITTQIAIIGGSLGSNYWKELLNYLFENLDLHLQKKLKFKIQSKNTSTKEFEDNKNIEFKEFYNTSELFKESDLVISRAGATSICEISAIGRPCALFAWEKSLENHQEKNAINYSKISKATINSKKEVLELIEKLQSFKYKLKLSQKAADAFPQYAKIRAAKIIQKI